MVFTFNERLYELCIDGTYRSLTFRANDRVRRGASGTVLELACEIGKATKIYHEHERAKFEPKVRAMLKVKYKRPHAARFDLAWPEALIVDGSGEFHGFKMPFFGSGVDLEVLVQASEAEEQYGLGERDRLVIAANLAMAVRALHELKVYCIDLKPENVRINLRTKAAAILDCDGMSVVDIGVKISPRFYADKCTPEYVAPEYMELRPHRFSDEEAQDRFSLAVIIFMLLNRGLHPYSGTLISNTPDCETTAGKIKSNLYPFGAKKGRITPHKHFLYPFLPAPTQHLFDRAFSGSKSRPSASEWLDHLNYLIGQTGTCSTDPMHIRFRTIGCPICLRDAPKVANLPADFIAPSSLIGAVNATSGAPSFTAPRSTSPASIASMSQFSSAGTRSSVRGSLSASSVTQPLTAQLPGALFHLPPAGVVLFFLMIVLGAGGLALYTIEKPQPPPPPPPQPQATVQNVMLSFGLFGAWGQVCNQPPGANNPYLTFSILHAGGGKVTIEQAARSEYLIRHAERLATNIVSMKWQGVGRNTTQSADLLIERGRFRIWTSIGADGTIFVKNGLTGGQKTPWQFRCESSPPPRQPPRATPRINCPYVGAPAGWWCDPAFEQCNPGGGCQQVGRRHN